jgi:hypothetical protein
MEHIWWSGRERSRDTLRWWSARGKAGAHTIASVLAAMAEARYYEKWSGITDRRSCTNMRTLRFQRLVIPVLALSVVLAFGGRADAHKLGAECTLHAGRVNLEAYYDDNTPARDARVAVEDRAQQRIAEGRTDANGCWSFAAPPPGDYLVMVDAGAGHRTQLHLTLPTDSSAVAATAPPDDCTGCDDPQSPTVTDGPTRDAFTRIPWMQLGVGVALLGAIGGGFWIARRITTLKTP